MATTTRTKESILTRYLREIGQTPLLTADEEQELATEIQERKSEDARQKLLRANLRLVVNIAKRYAPSHDPELLMDLIQEGNLGLMRAVDRFQPGRNTRFSTYGVYWIKQAILRHLKSRRLVRLPENVVDRVFEMQRVRQRLYQLLGRVPTSQEIAHEMNASSAEINRLEEAAADVISLDQTVRGTGESDTTELSELLEDVESPRPDQVARTELVKDSIREAVSSLPARERRIIEERFGLTSNQPRTLEDIGKDFNISRERVRQLQNSALNRLRARKSVRKAHT